MITESRRWANSVFFYDDNKIDVVISFCMTYLELIVPTFLTQLIILSCNKGMIQNQKEAANGILVIDVLVH